MALAPDPFLTRPYDPKTAQEHAKKLREKFFPPAPPSAKKPAATEQVPKAPAVPPPSERVFAPQRLRHLSEGDKRLVEKIVKVVAKRYHTTPAVLLAPASGRQTHSLPRYTSYYLARTMTKISMRNLLIIINRKGAESVNVAEERIRHLAARDPAFRKELEEIKQEVLAPT